MTEAERPTGYLSDEAVAALRLVSTATLTSQLLKHGFHNTFLGGLTALRPDLRMVGYAFTLRWVPMREDLDTGPMDNLTNVQRLAVEAVGRGDVLVMDVGGALGAGTLGNILASRILARGATGVVTDGALRDIAGFREIELPSYTRGGHGANSSSRFHPADLNVPIGCAGVLVMPGDVMVGDADGVVAIPRAVAEEVALAALEQEELEAFVLEKVQGGASIREVYPPNAETRAEYDIRRRQ